MRVVILGMGGHIGGEIARREVLAVQTPQSLKALLNLDVHVLSEALEIDRAGKRVRVRELQNNAEKWYAYDKRAYPILGVNEGERIAGFVHIGTPTVPPTERPRPELSEIVAWVGDDA